MGILMSGDAVAATGTGAFMLIYIVIIVAFIYFLMIRPQKKEQ